MKTRAVLSRIVLRAAAACGLLCAVVVACVAQTGETVSGFAEINGTQLYYETAGRGAAPDEKASGARRVGEKEGAEKYFEAFLASDLLAGLRTRPRARELMRRMMVENYKANAYISAGHAQSPEPPVETPAKFNRALLDFLNKR